MEAHNIAAARHSKPAHLEVELRGAQEERAEGNMVVRSLILGWGWGKWTCDL